MTRDTPETVARTGASAWQETALPATVEEHPAVRVSREDLQAAVHGGVITGPQAKALWLRWSNPGQAAARASGPGQRAMPETAAKPAGGSGLSGAVTALLVVVAAVAAWLLRGALNL